MAKFIVIQYKNEVRTYNKTENNTNTDVLVYIYIYIKGFPDSSVGIEFVCYAGDPCSIPGLGRSPGEGIGYPLQYSGLENSMDCIVRGVTKSQTGLSKFHFHLSIYKVYMVCVNAF